jgi:demethylmenaquinone methyltransferase/2-methoxy-6-polyprenyl-1,4-benzoquinol methylase
MTRLAEPAAVRRMFADVAPRYDFLNRTLSAGVDRLWRRRTVRRALALAGGKPRVLDVCTGTADLALAFAERGCEVVGADFCREMLVLGERKRRRAAAGKLRLLAADALRLPFADASFDVATVAFGIRNVADPELGLREMARVVRPGGSVVVLEFARPRTPVLGPLYLWYFRRVLPRLGAWLSPKSRDSAAYSYLPASVLQFPEREAFLGVMQSAGLAAPSCEPLSLGIAALYSASVRTAG